MREICTSGSEGGAGQTNAPSLPLSLGHRFPRLHALPATAEGGVERDESEDGLDFAADLFVPGLDQLAFGVEHGAEGFLAAATQPKTSDFRRQRSVSFRCSVRSVSAKASAMAA